MSAAITGRLRRLFGRKDGQQEKPAPARPNRRLTRAERKQIEAVIAGSKRNERRELSAQDSIPYQRMFPDGICRVTDTYYTKTVQFQDINYQLSQNDDKAAIFEGWSDFLNFFDSSVHVQISCLDLSTPHDSAAANIVIPLQKDDFNDVRREYTGILQNQFAKGSSGLTKTKYLTFGIEAENIRTAKPRLERIETAVLNNFKRLGVIAAPMDGRERLGLLHAIFHMDDLRPFRFHWDWLAPSGLSTKDFIAPSSFEFRNGRMFRVGRLFGAASFV